MEVSWPPSDMEAFRVLLVFLMKNLQFLHCSRANGTVTYDSQFMSFDTSILFLTGSELYCAQLSWREAAEARGGTVPTPTLKSCLWQMFLYLFKYIHWTKKVFAEQSGSPELLTELGGKDQVGSGI